MLEPTHKQVMRERGRLYYHLQHDNGGDLDAMMRDVGVPGQLIGRRLSHFTKELTPLLFDIRERLNLMLVQEGSGAPVSFKHGDVYGVALVGMSSTGKTSFVSSWLRKMIACGFTGKFTTVEQFAKFKTTWIELTQNASRYEDYASRADAWRDEMWRLQAVYEFMVIDDIGRTPVPTFVLGELHDLVRERAAHDCFTMLTSNLPLKELDVYVGDGFAAFLRREMIVEALTDKLEVENGGR